MTHLIFYRGPVMCELVEMPSWRIVAAGSRPAVEAAARLFGATYRFATIFDQAILDIQHQTDAEILGILGEVK